MNLTITKEMIKNSLVNKGDVGRIVEVIRKANSGQDINIAFLGGSITEGCNATSFEKCYASMVYYWFKEKFKNINVNLYVKVDETKAMLLNTYFKGGWGEYAETRILVNDLEIGKHKVEIRVVDEEKPVEVRVMGLLVS